MDPLRVVVVSSGAPKPLVDNNPLGGRWETRRIELLAYKDAMTTSPGRRRRELGRTGQTGASGTTHES